MEKVKNKYRLSLPIPDSILKQIDEFVEDKRTDGEPNSTSNRTVIAMEMLKIGCLVMQKRKANKDNEEPQITLDDKLALIAQSVLKIEFMENLLFYATKKNQEKTSLYMSDENHKKYLEEIEYKLSYFFKRK
ncbi:hypothetical protein QE197_21495 (plasmid) [Arsenophonus nasoniae]|uniref:Relaxosome protein TraM n=1 Tax=Arsenophonus nasoniae TaxID=638 RepID=A0A4P7L0N9_9GAMM|nr:hypothetical protein [Arsenophonus nasoniae]QBY46247.1 hypothetical protein ArsFIN_48580 [Arsenophonus nasoniae]WGM03289.1 hypothetical protein QE210_17960 [Arsenophonus nasoniae]WGM08162.1 hypothetical protein QE258_23100 [Arsenophonus nasoniae]WGM13011.1 hypothetical protein QE197_21495 [Arsenophonus nasoniae]WGM17742.1 hypothetical protein QE193_20775 [Arsenophonus nasoniae]